MGLLGLEPRAWDGGPPESRFPGSTASPSPTSPGKPRDLRPQEPLIARPGPFS